MIRRAVFPDIPEIEAMIGEMLQQSKYAGRVNIVGKDMRGLLLGMCQGQNRPGTGGTFLRVAVKGDKIVGFMAGVLQAVYFVGDKLSAEDVFLYVRPKAGATWPSRLIDEYVQWAWNNPKVVEVKLSYTDAIPGAEGIGKLYERKGFSPIGAIYDRVTDVPAEAAA
jgi:hypothetical protein